MRKEITQAINSQVEIESLFLCKEMFLKKDKSLELFLKEGFPINYCSESILKKFHIKKIQRGL